jgi:hypothetical protein
LQDYFSFVDLISYMVWNIRTFVAIATVVTSIAGITSFAISPTLASTTVQNNNNQTGTTNVTQQMPTDDYGAMTGPLTAVRHVYDDPTLRVYHYCKPSDKVMMVCQLYDGNYPNATLIGIEYMITVDQYNSLPEREKPYWHYHVEEFAPNRADPKFPQLSEEQTMQTLQQLEQSYGKVILTWYPNDNMPAFPPQVQIVQHPFMVNQTVTPDSEHHQGHFNQTLNY